MKKEAEKIAFVEEYNLGLMELSDSEYALNAYRKTNNSKVKELFGSWVNFTEFESNYEKIKEAKVGEMEEVSKLYQRFMEYNEDQDAQGNIWKQLYLDAENKAGSWKSFMGYVEKINSTLGADCLDNPNQDFKEIAVNALEKIILKKD